MKLTKCEQGHFYDGDKYPACPYCNTDLQTDDTIVHTSAAAGPAAEAAPPSGPVTGWLVVVEGPGRGRDLRLGIGRTFLGLDETGAPVTLSPDTPLSTRQAVVAYDEKTGGFTLLPGSSQQLCYLGGKAVLEPCALSGKEELQLGQAALRFVPFCGGRFHWGSPV